MTVYIEEPVFAEALRDALRPYAGARSVTGPGRSGAIASVYASHMLGLPWFPCGQPVPDKLRPVLVVDTARRTGATLRKAGRIYGTSLLCAVFEEPPRIRFWYEPTAARARCGSSALNIRGCALIPERGQPSNTEE